MKKKQNKVLWIVSILFLLTCSSPNQNLTFWQNTNVYSWNEYQANHSPENNEFQFLPTNLLIHAKSLDYPFAEWLLPYYEVYRPNPSPEKNAIKLGACLADLSYLAIYEKNFWLRQYRNYADSLKNSLYDNYKLPEFYDSYSENPDSMLIWVAATLGSLDLTLSTLQKKMELKHYVYFGAWLETLYIVAHSAAMKEDVSLFLKLQEHQSYLNFYQDFLKSIPSTKNLAYDVQWLQNQLLVTQKFNVWDSLENQFKEKIYPLKEPVLNLLKSVTELRKKWILEN